jgi:hypothetical protein
MATIKAFTTIEQSRKLAEILPLKSADMWWNYYSVTTDFGTPQIIHLDTPWVGSFNWYNEPDNIPCWSLAALLDVLPRETRLLKSATDDTKYHCDCPKGNIDEWFDNPIDACYEMILKLHEINLL